MALTIFYAWQSDTHPKANHYLIRDALDEAIKALNAQPPRRSQYDRALIRGDKPDASWIVHGGFNT